MTKPRRSRTACIESVERRTLLATLPTGFIESTVASGLSGGAAMEFAPDGKLFVASQWGKLSVWQNGTRRVADFFERTPLALRSDGERGLLGVAFDPNYATNRAVYVYYTTPGSDAHNRVSRFTADATGDRAVAGSEDVILELDAHSASNHNGGAMHFGADGLLYVATGDNAAGANAQSLANRHGKMLRIDVRGDDFPADGGNDYRIPAGQPTTFPGIAGTTSGVNRAIWAVGLRNPFTFAFQPGTGRLFINDVGQNTWEEINEGGAGRNFGWPGTEGAFSQSSNPNFTQPFYAYDHGGAEPNGVAITGGAFYNPTTPQFPSSYVGDYFFADYGSGKIWSIDTATKAVTQFASGASAVVDLKADSAGGLYYLDRGAGEVRRVQFASAPPSITDAPDAASVTIGKPATFAATASGAGPLKYQWQRAESGTTTFANINGATAASFTLAGVQASDNGDRFRVVVTDAVGRSTASAFATLTATANQPPSAAIAITGGLRNGKFDAGKAITFAGAATDPEQGTLGAASFTWKVEYLSTINGGDADGDGLPGITRPFVTQFGNAAGGTFTPATTGPYTLADVAYAVTLTATDSAGRADVERSIVNPNVVTLTAATNPGGLQVTVDGQPFASPRTFASVVGFQRPVGVATSQTLGGKTYTFQSWSDGGAATHTIATPTTNATYAATFTTPSTGTDTTPPVVVSRTPAPGATVNGSSLNIDVAFSETVRNVDMTDLGIGGTATTPTTKRFVPVHLGNNVWRWSLSGLTTGQLYLRLSPDVNDIEDLAGNDAKLLEWGYAVKLGATPPTTDVTPPTVLSRTPTPGATVRGSSLNIDVAFSEEVRNVDMTDLGIGGTATTPTTKRFVPIHLGNNVWRWSLSGLTTGQLYLRLSPDVNDIEDLAGNDAGLLEWSVKIVL